MIKKGFKTILIIFSCFVLSLPTNAAVSVSDGSAFVTKAEFSADLNNLSNRMAQLENSLDAKIDSLVSSYLTRNGIWNGAKQFTENFSIKYKDILAPIKNAIITVAGRTDSLANSAYDIISWTSVPVCDKSGLLVFDFQCNHNWSYSLYERGGSYKHSIWQGVFTNYFQLSRKIGTDTYEMLGTRNGGINLISEYYNGSSNDSSPTDDAFISVAASNNLLNLQVFVNKGDEIKSSFVVSYSGRKSGVTVANFTSRYNFSYIDKVTVDSSSSALANTDIIWECEAYIY